MTSLLQLKHAQAITSALLSTVVPKELKHAQAITTRLTCQVQLQLKHAQAITVEAILQLKHAKRFNSTLQLKHAQAITLYTLPMNCVDTSVATQTCPSDNEK